MSAAPNRSPIAVARDEYFASDEAKRCMFGSTSGIYLRNRLEQAFLAGYNAAESCGQMRPIDSAPKDGRLLKLWIADDDVRDNPLQDHEGPTTTIGFNTLHDTGEDEWIFAGWCWQQDRFTAGVGKPIGWAPFGEENETRGAS